MLQTACVYPQGTISSRVSFTKDFRGEDAAAQRILNALLKVHPFIHRRSPGLFHDMPIH
jgi:hypothetical protein